MVGARGQLLLRSIIDPSVGLPERLVFEGPPLVVAPLAQDQAARQPQAHEGALLDTLAACPPLTAAEERRFNELVDGRQAGRKATGRSGDRESRRRRSRRTGASTSRQRGRSSPRA